LVLNIQNLSVISQLLSSHGMLGITYYLNPNHRTQPTLLLHPPPSQDGNDDGYRPYKTVIRGGNDGMRFKSAAASTQSRSCLFKIKNFTENKK